MGSKFPPFKNECPRTRANKLVKADVISGRIFLHKLYAQLIYMGNCLNFIIISIASLSKKPLNVINDELFGYHKILSTCSGTL